LRQITYCQSCVHLIQDEEGRSFSDSFLELPASVPVDDADDSKKAARLTCVSYSQNWWLVSMAKLLRRVEYDCIRNYTVTDLVTRDCSIWSLTAAAAAKVRILCFIIGVTCNDRLW